MTVSSEERRALVDRIAASTPFRNSARLREFLLFVADRALTDHLDEITEQQIGHAVFRRTVDYDTANDNIVRVSARQLRNKLRDYFDEEGRSEALVMEIPKGGYVPRFHPRRETAPAASPARKWQIATITLALTTAALAILLFARVPGRPAEMAAKPTLADVIITPGQRTLIVLPDSGLLLLQQLTGRPVTAGEYADHQEESEALREVPSDVLPFLRGQQLTSAAHIGLALRLLRLRPDAADRVSVYHARGITARNLKEGHALLLGGPRANPWAALFEERLNFRFDFGGGRPRARILNHAPRNQEPREFESPAGGKGYARLALVPNLARTGKILLISGTTTEATEAAAEFLIAPASIQLLQRTFSVKDVLSLGGFEVLLETESVGGTARESKVISFRLPEP
jgi:hypothetical protein